MQQVHENSARPSANSPRSSAGWADSPAQELQLCDMLHDKDMI